MARRRRGQPVNGWVVLDKPEGMTSTQAVSAVRRAFDAQKAGHAGTLDPVATGVLPIALGEATKTVPFAVDGDKTYRFTLRWGEATDTEDREGRVTAVSEVRPGRDAIAAVLPRFLGEITQVPPRYSAIKIDGQRAYDLARAEEVVEMAPRQVRIDRLELVALPDADHAVFEVDCGKGTYMRSLGRDIALALGSLGHLVALRRLAVGPFTEEMAIPLDFLDHDTHGAAVYSHLLPLETALDDIPALALSEPEAARLRNGQPVSLMRSGDLARLAGIEAGDLVLATAHGSPVAIGRIERGALAPVRVLNL
ncbi:MAG: tRNA pseudouridine(55) synthase TruB [Thalassobaculales bacterium]